MFIFRPVSRTVLGSTPSTAYVFGGFNGSSVVNTIQSYDGVAINTESYSLATATSEAGSTSIDRIMYIFGGKLQNTIQNVTNGVISTDSATLVSYASVGICATTLGTLAIIFSSVAGSASHTVHTYNGTTRAQVGTLSGQRDYGCASTLSAVSYEFGGGDWASNLPTNGIRKWDGSTFAAAAGSLSSSRWWMSAATLSSAIKVFGGYQGGSTYLNYIQSYDGSTCTTDSATLASGNGGSSAAVIGSNAYIFGGHGPFNTIQKYTGTTRSTESATLSSALGYSTATSIPGFTTV